MEDRDNKSPQDGANANLEQAQAGHPPAAQQQHETSQAQPPETGQAQPPEAANAQPPETSQAEQPSEQPDFLGQSEALTEQRSDIEGSSEGSPAAGQAEQQPGFVGSDGASDTSSGLVEEEDFAKDGQGAPEGK